jgi:hypothetical protein
MKLKLSWLFSFLTWLLLLLNPVYAQLVSMKDLVQRVYNIVRNNKIIGSVTVNSLSKNNQFMVRTETNFNIQMVTNFEAKAVATNTFSANTLIHATMCRTLNGKVKTDNEIQFKAGRYQVIKGNSKQAIQQPINYTVSGLYLYEPANISEVFSEVYLQYLKIKRIAPAVYETILPDGGLMTYTYKSGVLTNVVAKTAYVTVQYQLKK